METDDFQDARDQESREWSQDSQFIDLTIREHMMDLHEQLALVWEEDEARLDHLDPKQRAQHRWLEQAYTADIGVHPRNRVELKNELAVAIQEGSRRSLAKVLSVVNDQSSNRFS